MNYNMRHSSLLVLFFLLVSLTGLSQTNDFYDDAETHDLSFPVLYIDGEVANPGKVDFSKLPLRSVLVKEDLLKEGKDQFIGAYRYEGYSLYDILNNSILQKKNEAEFPPIIDLYVEIENTAGEKVIFSWGEIYYPIHRHEIIIASKVTRIVPSKTKELWDLQLDNKVVAASDLLTERNISNPVRITVRSYEGKFNIIKGMSPMFSESFTIFNGNSRIETMSKLPDPMNTYRFPAVFYGRGRGIHGTAPFDGVMLKQLLEKHFAVSREYIRKGFFVINGKDGYHGVFTYSEILNRNDQAEFLLVPLPANQDGGAFRIFAAADFFSDRAINSVESIKFELLK